MASRPSSSNVRTVLEASNGAKGNSVAMFTLAESLNEQLDRVQACKPGDDLNALIQVRDGARQALKAVPASAPLLVRLAAEQHSNELPALERVITTNCSGRADA